MGSGRMSIVSSPVGRFSARLDASHELGRRRDAYVRRDQRFLEPLPRCLVRRIERAARELVRQCPAALAERVAQPEEETFSLAVIDGVAVPEELCPRPRHGRER